MKNAKSLDPHLFLFSIFFIYFVQTVRMIHQSWSEQFNTLYDKITVLRVSIYSKRLSRMLKLLPQPLLLNENNPVSVTLSVTYNLFNTARICTALHFNMLLSDTKCSKKGLSRCLVYMPYFLTNLNHSIYV